MWSRLGIRNKILLLFFVVGILPLIVINLLWLTFSQNQLELAAASRQSVQISSMTQRINNTFDTQIKNIVSTSQDPDVTNLNIEAARIKLLQFAAQNNDMPNISLVDDQGNELVVIEDSIISDDLTNVKNTEPFKVVTFVSNQPYISSFKQDPEQPMITISVPLLSFDSQLGDQDLTTGEALARRFGADIGGALIVDVDLSEVWQSVLTTQLGEDGYVFLIDSGGNILVHPDQSLVGATLNELAIPEIQRAREVLGEFDIESVANDYQPSPRIGASESGAAVLSSSYPISKTRWAVIGEEPVSSVYSAVNRLSAVASVIFIVGVPAAVTIILLATRTIITPIRQLTQRTLRLSSGNFDEHLVVKGDDELSILARTFNKMGSSLHELLEKLNEQNRGLRAEQVKLQAVLDTIADGVVALDYNFRIVLANKTAASFVDVKNPNILYGKPWLNVFSLYYDEEIFTNTQLDGELQYFHDVTMRQGDHPRFIDITVLRLHDDPNGIAFILTVQDTTPRRELENMKLDFVSMAAHELRTPLTAIRGYLDLLANDNYIHKEHGSRVSLASANVSTLESLINNMLSLSRIERGALQINNRKLDWQSLIREEIERLHFAADAKKIHIKLHTLDDAIYVWGDEVALQEVLGNLISNAIHYSDEGKDVEVRVEHKNDHVLTTISDQGIGIPDKLQDRLFTKYYRARGGLTTNSQGTGIGLFISRAIVEAHGGSIGFRSTFGKGSQFYFTLDEFDEHKHRQDNEADATITARSKVDWFPEKNSDS